MDLVLINQLLNLKNRDAHFYAQVFNFFTASHHATVIITQHHHRFANQIGSKNPLTRYVKIIAINQCNERMHDLV
jgi:hypothetical protein